MNEKRYSKYVIVGFLVSSACFVFTFLINARPSGAPARPPFNVLIDTLHSFAGPISYYVGFIGGFATQVIVALYLLAKARKEPIEDRRRIIIYWILMLIPTFVVGFLCFFFIMASGMA